MGTKFQYAINLLAAAAAPSNNSFPVCDFGYSLEIGPRKTHLETNCCSSVDEMFDPHNTESIKKTMLLHEDIFKRQVRELHRLYERQMKLMYELKKSKKNSEFSSNWHQDLKSNLSIYGMREDQREPTASCSGESPRMLKGLKLQTIEEECPSTSSIPAIEQQEQKVLRSNYNGLDDEEIDVDLTLSIGFSSSTKRRSELENSSSSSTNSSIRKKEKGEEKGAILNQNIGRSNWIFQDLSLNRT